MKKWIKQLIANWKYRNELIKYMDDPVIRTMIINGKIDSINRLIG